VCFLVNISIIEKIEAKILSAYHIPKTSWCEKVKGVHFVMEACLITLYFFEIVNDLDKTIDVILSLFFWGMIFFFSFGFLSIKVFIILAFNSHIFILMMWFIFNSKRRPSRIFRIFCISTLEICRDGFKWTFISFLCRLIHWILQVWWLNQKFIHKRLD